MVVRNRVNADLGHDGKPDWWGEGYAGVCTKPQQFSCWDEEAAIMAQYQTVLEVTSAPMLSLHYPVLALCREIAVATIAGRLADNTNGATHYLTKELYDRSTPLWAKDKPVNQLGSQVFLNA